VLAFEFHQGPRRSGDGGRTWAPLDLEWRGRFGKVFGVVSRGDTIAASTGGGASDWRITISRDSGKTWSMLRWPGQVVATGVGPNGEIFVTKRGGDLLRAVAGVQFGVFATGFERLGGEVHRVLPLAGGKRLLLLGPVGAATCDAADGKNLEMLDPPVTGTLHWPDAALDGGGALYVTAPTGRMYRRALPAGAWETVRTEDAQRLVGIVSDPGSKGRRIAAFANGLLLRSDDGGTKWRPLARFGACQAIGIGTPRRLHVVADGAVRTLDLSKVE